MITRLRNARMNFLTFVRVAAGCLLVMSVAGCAPAQTTPDTFESVGNFEIVTHTIHFKTGWNEGRIRNATTEAYSLRFRGEPLTIEGKAGMWGDKTMVYDRVDAVITFAASEPAIIVNVGDPNNSSFYYLVRDRDDRPLVEYLGDSSGGVSAGWLDPQREGGYHEMTPEEAALQSIRRHRPRLARSPFRMGRE